MIVVEIGFYGVNFPVLAQGKLATGHQFQRVKMGPRSTEERVCQQMLANECFGRRSTGFE